MANGPTICFLYHAFNSSPHFHENFCICYDLNSPGQDYKDLIEKIKSYGTWWHHLDSTWLVNTEKTAVQIRGELKAYLDKNDELLVFNVGSNWAGQGFSKEAYDWLKKNWISG